MSGAGAPAFASRGERTPPKNVRTVTIVFDNDALMPSEWRDSVSGIRAFNPGLLRAGDGWLLAYRIVAEPALRRQIALCRLDRDLRIVPGSPVPLSDRITVPPAPGLAPEARLWFADPRLYRLEGRLFIYWNSGWHEPQNHQFLQELDPATLAPVGAPRELVLRGHRQKLEKNWTLFECDGLHAVYSIRPHRILTFSLAGEGAIKFADAGPAHPNPGGHARSHGGLRGGAPPQRHGGQFYSFCHSIADDPAGYRYLASVYRFEGRPPFRPTHLPQTPLALDLPARARRALPKLNPAVSDVVYPAGAAYADGRWIVSCGIDDEHCALAVLDEAEIERTLAPAEG